MDQFELPLPGLDVPAWFGKLPGMGDFAQRRLAPYFLDVWDPWLQQGLQHLRKQHEDWVTHYLEAPLWFFALGQKVAGVKPWIGVLMPSVDSVGRYFPLTLAIELERSSQTMPEQNMANIHCWWVRSAQTALSALQGDLDAARFDAALHAQFASTAVESVPMDSLPKLPIDGTSLWFTNMGAQDETALSMKGLPTNTAFNTLFGCINMATIQQQQ
jgi:type VI secretion system protein ImpM